MAVIVNPVALPLATVNNTVLNSLWVTVPKLIDEGGLNVGTESVPVPFSVIVEDGVLALLIIARPPVTAPCAVGLKSTVIVQLAPAPSPEGKVLHPSD